MDSVGEREGKTTKETEASCEEVCQLYSMDREKRPYSESPTHKHTGPLRVLKSQNEHLYTESSSAKKTTEKSRKKIIQKYKYIFQITYTCTNGNKWTNGCLSHKKITIKGKEVLGLLTVNCTESDCYV